MTPGTVAHQTPLSMGFPREKYWSGLPFPSPGNHPNPAKEPTSPALAGGFFIAEPPGKPRRDHILGHETRLNKFRRIEIISRVFYDHSGMKLEINYRKKNGKE